MPLPTNVTTVTVLGTFLTPEGNPSTGTITFTPSSWLTNPGANVAIPNSAVTKTLGTAGDFQVLLPVTDDADLSPDNWVYNVSEVVDGVSQNYNVLLPGTVAVGGTVYLADLAPAAPAGPEYYSLASSLTIGTVTTVATGGSATATITGLAPSQVLNLGIPVGATGTVSTAGSGSAGTAAVAPTGDTNTGLFFPAADTVAVTTGGTERMRVTSTGLVGIGTTAPNQQLTIARDTGVGQRLQTSASNAFILLDRSGSTIASPTIVASGEILGSIAARGYDGSTFRTAAQILFGVDGTPGASDMPGNIQFQTVPDDSITATERMRLDRNGLITGTGTSLGAWTAYTPTLGGTGWAIGDGTVGGRYVQIGKVVHYRAFIQFGSTSTYGAVSPTITMPTASQSTARRNNAHHVSYFDTSLSKYYRGNVLHTQGDDNLLLYTMGTTGEFTTPSSTAPFTWASGDIIWIAGTYEAA